MATATKSVSSAWVAVAQGAGDVVFSFDDAPGEFTVHSASDPAAIVAGHKQPKETPFSMTLQAGEYLHLRGRGTATVTAGTLV